MYKVDKKNSFYLSSVFDSPLKKSSTSPHWPLNLRVSIVIKISKAVALLHEFFFVICDFKPENILVNKDGSVIFLDCDSFGVDSPSFKLPPTHFSPGYILPELLTSNSPPSKASYSQDLYALSVIIFKILNYGVHPFQGVIQNNKLQDIDSDDDKARLRLYPYSYVLPNPDISPSPISIHNCFPINIRNSFDDIFINKVEISANRWDNLLSFYIDNYAFSKCDIFPDSTDHIKFKDFDCGVCFINNFNKSKPLSSSTNRSTPNDKDKYNPNSQPPNKSPNDFFYIVILPMIVVFLFVIYLLRSTNSFTPETKTSSSTNKNQFHENISYHVDYLFVNMKKERIFYNDIPSQYKFNFEKVNDYIKIKLNSRSLFSNGVFYFYNFDLGPVNYIDFYGSDTEECLEFNNHAVYFYCHRKNSSLFRCTYGDEKVNFKYTCLYSIST